MKRYRLYLLDMDGVLFRGKTAIPGAADAVQRIRQAGALVRFLTNNSTKTREHNARILREFGMEASPNEIMTTAVAAARFLGGRTAWALGEPGLHEELLAGNVKLVRDEPAEWVVVGLQRDLSYGQIDEAQWRIRTGAKFLATNRDATYPVEGRVMPGAGAIVAAVATAAGKEPDLVIGKPEPRMIQCLLEETGVRPEEALLVGDRLDTDIECARRAGCDALLVLTGVTSEPPGDVPSLPSIADLSV